MEVFTLDGNPKTLNSPFVDKERHFVVRTDKEYKIVNENNEVIKFDLITSFEHLEHIQEKTIRQYLKNILAHIFKWLESFFKLFSECALQTIIYFLRVNLQVIPNKCYAEPFTMT